MRRTLLGLAGAATLVITLTACGDSGDDSADPAGCTTSDASVTVAAQDALTFDADSYEADAGCVEITYTNEGSVAHTLLIKGKSGFKLSVGDTDTGTIELTAGDYVLYCDIAGHEAAGMKADLTVS
jgi:plastocyanin